MKKTASVVFTLFAALLITSCTSRSYDCKCIYKDPAGTGAMIRNTTTVKGSQKEAQNACNAHGTYLSRYLGATATCTL
jgi:hypothetical protein